MSDLAAFLLARIAEDEAAFRSAADGYHWDEIERYLIREIRPGAPIVFTETRALAECEAKRRVVALHGATSAELVSVDRSAHPARTVYAWGQACTECGSVDDCPEPWPCTTLRLLAQPYSDHPDYREDWRLTS